MSSNLNEVLKDVNMRFMINYPHYVLPGLNLTENMDLTDCMSRESFPYSCYLPLPVLPSSMTNVVAVQDKDPALTLVKKKLQWNHDIKLHCDTFAKAKKIKDMEKLLKSAKKQKNASFSAREAQFLKLLAKNPDEFFDGTYNWYFTGGCMSKIELNNAMLVLFTQGKKMDCICALPTKNGKKWKVDSSVTIGTPAPNSTIYELCCRNINENGIVGVRVRNGCCIYSLTSLNRMELLHRSVSSAPFTSLDISKHLKGRYCTASTERQINVWDTEADFYTFSMTVPKPQKNLPDKWNCVRWSNSRSIVMADREYIQIIDVRKKDVTELFSVKKEPYCINDCEMISMLYPSTVSSTGMYVTTTHQVLLYDTRNSSKPLQRWNHLLRAPPLYGDIVSIEDGKEALYFANQELGEISMFLNNWHEEEPFIELPVVALPNMNDAVRAAHKHGLWLDPVIQKQAQLSWTGMTCLSSHKSKMTLLAMNSAGDVFSQILKLKKEDQGNLNDTHSGSEGTFISDYSARNLKCLKMWETNVVKRKKPFTLKATKRVKMKHLFNSLKNSSFVLGKLEGDNSDADSDNERWKLSKAELLGYKDVMAPVLLQAWEIDEEDEWKGDKCKSSVPVPEQSPTASQKVAEWLTVSEPSSDLLADTNTPGNATKRKNNRTVTQDRFEYVEINGFPYSLSETQNEMISRRSTTDAKCTPMPSSATSSKNYMALDTFSHIFSSTPHSSRDILSQDMFSSQLYSSQNTILSPSAPKIAEKTVPKNKYISGF